MKNVLITTLYKGVFFGKIADDADITAKKLTNIKDCRMAIRWGTTKGVMELADTGPTDKSRISSKCDVPVLHGVTAVFQVTNKAAEVWEAK